MTDPARAARLTAIAERLKAATQGEWYVEHPQVYYKIRVAETRAYILEQNYGGIRDEADAYLIANAPADLRFLLAHVETLTQQVAELTATLKEQAFEQTFADLRRAEQQRDAAHAALREVEQHCPCGARPESLRTHPHVIGCPVGKVLYPAAPAQETERGR